MTVRLGLKGRTIEAQSQDDEVLITLPFDIQSQMIKLMLQRVVLLKG